jgi:hypothetical protein
MEGFSALDLQVFQEKSRTFCGSVKVPLGKLQHEEIPEKPRQTDQKNIERLVGVFGGEGCWRLDPDNHIEGLIPLSDVSEIHPTTANLFPLYNPSSPLKYLNGHHRIEAARKFLTGNDRWWVVDLYSEGAWVDLAGCQAN